MVRKGWRNSKWFDTCSFLLPMHVYICVWSRNLMAPSHGVWWIAMWKRTTRPRENQCCRVGCPRRQSACSLTRVSVPLLCRQHPWAALLSSYPVVKTSLRGRCFCTASMPYKTCLRSMSHLFLKWGILMTHAGVGETHSMATAVQKKSGLKWLYFGFQMNLLVLLCWKLLSSRCSRVSSLQTYFSIVCLHFNANAWFNNLKI